MILFRILLIFAILQVTITGNRGRKKKDLGQFYDEIAEIVKFKKALDIYKLAKGSKDFIVDDTKYQDKLCKYCCCNGGFQILDFTVMIL